MVLGIVLALGICSSEWLGPIQYLNPADNPIAVGIELVGIIVGVPLNVSNFCALNQRHLC